MRTSTVFKSRWMALIWAAGIIWFAYDFAGSQPQESECVRQRRAGDRRDRQPLTSDDTNKLANALNSF